MLKKCEGHSLVLSSPSTDQSLEETLEDFLEVSDADCGIFTGETFDELREILRQLLAKLTTSKAELLAILHATGVQLSEVSADSLVHRLVARLSDVSQTASKDISTLTTACLGEIGPLPFGTLAVKPEEHLLAENANQPEKTNIPFLAGEILMKYYASKDNDVVLAAEKAVKTLLSSRDVRELSEISSHSQFSIFLRVMKRP